VDSLEGVIGLIWLMFFVGSIVRAIAQGKRRAEQEAARRAMRRAQGLPRQAPTQHAPRGQVFRPGWPVYPGQPAQPVVVVEQRESQSQGEGEGQSGGEGESAEGEPAEGDSRDIRRRLRQERSEEWQSDRARTWEMPVDTGSLGAEGEAVDEPIAKSAEAFEADLDREALDWVLDEDMVAQAGTDVGAAERLERDVGMWRIPGRVEPEHALAGIVWGTVLAAPRCRLTRHR